MFTDRADAGRRLGERLSHLKGQDLVVLGLPRGGVPVAFQVAQTLDAPLDVIVVRKLGLPHQPELAMGAIGEDDVRVLDFDVLRRGRVSDAELEQVHEQERSQLQSTLARLRSGRPRIDLTARTAVVVDDGLATGSTARAACLVARRLGATRIVLAVPVAPAGVLSGISEADDAVCVCEPTHFVAVGQHYRDFSPTSDVEVIQLLNAPSSGQ
ncbi:MAG TPA: phosphoribosyltransferase [Propionibacteriaceae bacterium]|nr:phosphoribosyltransferase [Propionibacteriaceae bacterium]